VSHLLLALSGHGFGHLAQGAAVVNALRKLRPGVRVTVCGSLARDVVADKLERPFDYRRVELDPVLRMVNAWQIDIPASLQRYREFHRHWEAGLQQDGSLLAELAPDLVLADIPYRILLAAQRASVPAIGLCSLNWAAIYANYFSSGRTRNGILAQMRAGYRAAEVFLAPEPALPMPELANYRPIGPIARAGRNRRHGLRAMLSLPPAAVVVLVALGGIATEMPFPNWPRMEDVHWLFTGPVPAQRNDLRDIRGLKLPFIDVLASADAVLTKPGYGTYAEAVCNGIPLLALERPDWPETEHLNSWARRHGRLQTMSRTQFERGTFAAVLQDLLAQPVPGPIPEPLGNRQAAGIIMTRLQGDACHGAPPPA
jgi:hypothetical protein